MRINFWKKENNPAFFQDETVVQEEAYFEEMPVVSTAVEMSDTARVYNRVAGWIVAVGVLLLPLFFLPFTTGPLELNKQILLVGVAGAALVVWLLGVVISGQMSLRYSAMDKGVGAMLLGTVIVTVFSLAGSNSVFGSNNGASESLVTILALSMLYFVAVNVFDDHGKRLLTFIGISSLLALIYGLAQLFTLFAFNFGIAHSRAFNSVGSVNALGLLAALSLPLFSKIKMTVANVKYLDLGKLGLVVAVVILAILNWWVLWTVAIAAMLALTALDSFSAARGQHDGAWKASRFLLPMTIIGLGVFLMIVRFSFAPVRGNLPVEVAPSYTLANRVVSSTLSERLVFGYGPENYSLAFDRYGAGSLANTNISDIRFFDSPAQVLNWVTGGGIVMGLAVLFFLWTLVETFLKSRSHGTSFASPEFSGTVAVLAGFVVALFVYPLNITLTVLLYTYCAVLVLIVWGDRARVMNIEDRPIISLASSVGFIVGLILVLAGSYFTALHYIADVTYAKALAAKTDSDQTQLLVDAINWNDRDDRFYRSISQTTLSMLSTEINKKADPSDTERPARISNYIQSSITFARQATEAGPLDATNWFNLGAVYQALIGLVDNVEQLAEDAFLKAAELRPGDASFYGRAGSMHLARADLFRQLARSGGANATRLNQEANRSLDKAEGFFKQAIEKSESFGLAIYNLGAVYDRQGKTSEAIQQIEKILPSNASQPSLFFELGLLYYRAGRKADALDVLNQAVLLAPQYANARWYLALILEENKDYDGAIAQLEKILETNRENGTVIGKIAELKAGQFSIPPERVLDQQPLE